MQEIYAHSDATTVQVLKEVSKTAQSKSTEWVYCTSAGAKRKITLYEYKPSHSHKHPMEFLKGFKGFLHTDGHKVYDLLPVVITVVGCWAHARRYWEPTWKATPEDKRKGSIADTALQYINALFKLERDFVKAKLTPQQRYEKRLAESMPISDAFFALVDVIAQNQAPQTPLGKACTYAKNQRNHLENIFLDGNLELSNNRCERSVKPFVMGRKAWLFSSTPEGAEASSIMYSIIETAKANNLHPFYYVKFLLESLPNMNARNDLEALLPWSDSLPPECRVL